MIPAHTHKSEYSIAQLLEEREVGKGEQSNRISPLKKPSLRCNSHGGGAPAHLVGDSEFGKQLEGRCIRFADEVIEPFEGNAFEVKMTGHTARVRSSLEHVDTMAIDSSAIARCQAHGTGSDNYNVTHFEFSSANPA